MQKWINTWWIDLNSIQHSGSFSDLSIIPCLTSKKWINWIQSLLRKLKTLSHPFYHIYIYIFPSNQPIISLFFCYPDFYSGHNNFFNDIILSLMMTLMLMPSSFLHKIHYCSLISSRWRTRAVSLESRSSSH